MVISKNCKSGFTLAEIMIVIAIIGILAATVGPMLYNNLQKARVNKIKTELRTYKAAIEQFNADTGVYPNVLNDLVVCPKGLELKWMGGFAPKKGGYVLKINKDAFGNAYVYKLEEYQGNPYTLYSHGQEGLKSKTKIHVWDLD